MKLFEEPCVMPRRRLEIQDEFVIKDKMVKDTKKSKEENTREDPEDVRAKFMTYFLLFFPTIILIAIPGTINGGIVLSISLKALIAFYQFVTLKTFVDKHYE